MSRSKHVKEWRKRTKQRMVTAFGNVCCVCKKSFPPELYDFHHVDGKKEFGLASARANIISWKRLVDELRKCVLVCSNCHRLVEYGYKKVPGDANRFDENYAEYKEAVKLEPCPICGKMKPKHNKTCSLSCGARIRYNVDWDNVDLLKLYKKYKTYVGVGKILGCSDNTVRKRVLNLKKFSG